MFNDFDLFLNKSNSFFEKNLTTYVYTTQKDAFLVHNFNNFFSDITGFYKPNLTVIFFYRFFNCKPYILLFDVSSTRTIKVGDNWVFREFNEFFGKIFLTYSDNRSLLLDYNANYQPLSKFFPHTGSKEIYFNYSYLDCEWVDVNHIEL